MIFLIDLEHENLKQEKPNYWPQVAQRRLEMKYLIEQLTGEVCLIVHYTKLNTDLIHSLTPQLIVVTGNNTDFEAYGSAHLACLNEVFLDPPCPIVTICGSFQLMVKAHGGTIGPIGEIAIPEGSQKHDPIIPSGWLNECGYCDVKVEAPGAPVFSGLSSRVNVAQHHFWEVKTYPPTFERLASSDLVAVQALQHQSLPLVGVQFHPEVFSPHKLDGLHIFENLLALRVK